VIKEFDGDHEEIMELEIGGLGLVGDWRRSLEELEKKIREVGWLDDNRQ
jgi:hypothetical protein